MAEITYAAVRRYADTLGEVSSSARDTFLERAKSVNMDDWSAAASELRAIANEVCRVYGLGSAELAAQWYEYCHTIAGIDTDYIPELRPVDSSYDVNRAIDKLFAGQILPEQLAAAIGETVTANVMQSARNTVMDNQRSEAERYPKVKHIKRYARVTMGDACAFCIMLASQGDFYVSEKSALLTKSGDKFHADCRCVAVPFAKAESISGYGEKLQKSRDEYNRANQYRKDGDMPDELSERIAKAKAEHQERYKAGEVERPWQPANETLIIMRYQQGIS